MRARTATILLAMMIPALDAAAQARDTIGAGGGVHGSRPGWSVTRTMREFLRDGDVDADGFMPRRGSWDYVLIIRQPSGTDVFNTHRIPAGQTAAAIARPDGLLCNSFHSGVEGTVEGTLATHAAFGSSPWRRRGTRFETRDDDLGHRIFVDWRREDGRWVVAAVGEEREYQPRVVGRVAEPPRDSLYGRPLRLPIPKTAPLAGDAEWYRSGRGFVISGPPYLKYGEPKQVPSGGLVYYTTRDGVMMYTTPEELRSSWGPTMLYVPVDREGTFQPYVGWRGNGCN